MNKILLSAVVCLVLILLIVRSCAEHGSGMTYRELKLVHVFTDPGARDLALAAARGETGHIDELLAQGVDINYAGQHGITPLRWAIAFENYRGYSYLLEKGADPNRTVTDDWLSVMHKAARTLDARFLIKAIEKGGDPNLVDPSSKDTPIFDAVLDHGTERLQILLEAGADPNYQDIVGETVLFPAVRMGKYEAAYFLVKSGLDPTLQSKRGHTVTYWMEGDERHYDEYAHKLLALIAEKEKEKEK